MERRDPDSTEAGKGKEKRRAEIDAARGQIDRLRARQSRSVQLRHEFPGYAIEREIHRGGQGIVYQATEATTQRRVAIKILHGGEQAALETRQRFQREIQLAAGLKHPNIITVYSSGETIEGVQFCVMDYIRGLPLDRFVRRQDLSVRETLRLIARVCDAVHFAHRRGVIHRDLKPSNVLVEADASPKVLDFGLAKSLNSADDAIRTQAGTPLGTLAYMSPEQVQANPDAIDTRTDVYSLGVILYQVLTGVFPYPINGPLVEVLKHISTTPPVPPSDSNADYTLPFSDDLQPFSGRSIDSEVEAITLKALAKEPDRRYEFAGDMARDIERYLNGEPVEAKGDSLRYRMGKLIRRYRWPLSVAAGYMVLVTSGLIGALISNDKIRSANLQTLTANTELQAANEEVLKTNVELESANVAITNAQAAERRQFRVIRLQEEALQAENFIARSANDSLTKRLERLVDVLPDSGLRLEIHAALGNAYFSLSQLDRAQAQIESVIQLAKDFGGQDATVLEYQNRLASVLIRKGEFSKSQLLLETLLDEADQMYGDSNRISLKAQTNLAHVYKEQKQFKKAEVLYRKILTFRETQATDGVSDAEQTVLTVKNNLGSLYYTWGFQDDSKWPEAETLLQETLGRRRETLGNQHAKTVTTLNSLGGLYTVMGQLEKSKSLLDEALISAGTLYQNGEFGLAMPLWYHGRCLKSLGEFQKAEEELRRAREILTAYQGPNASWVGEVDELLSEIQTDRNHRSTDADSFEQ